MGSTIHPQTESYWGNVNTIGLRACYDEGKRCAETLFFDYHRQNKVNIRVVRIFNTYGPRMHPERKDLSAISSSKLSEPSRSPSTEMEARQDRSVMWMT
jgi:nucleoside-diphosphate-sugar epimerase